MFEGEVLTAVSEESDQNEVHLHPYRGTFTPLPCSTCHINAYAINA